MNLGAPFPSLRPLAQAFAVAVARAPSRAGQSEENPLVPITRLKTAPGVTPARFLASAWAKPLLTALEQQQPSLPLYTVDNDPTEGTCAQGPLALAYFLRCHPEAHIDLWELIKDQLGAATGTPRLAPEQVKSLKPTPTAKPTLEPKVRMYPPLFRQPNPGFVEVRFSPVDKTRNRTIIESAAPGYVNLIPVGPNWHTARKIIDRLSDIILDQGLSAMVSTVGQFDGRYANNLRIRLKHYLKWEKFTPAVIE